MALVRQNGKDEVVSESKYLSVEQKIEKVLQLVKERKSGDFKLSMKEGWENFTRSQKNGHAIVCDIENVETLKEFLKIVYQVNAADEHKNPIFVRAASGGQVDEWGNPIKYSDSYTANPQITEADFIIRLPKLRSLSVDESGLAEIGSGLRIVEIEQELLKKGFALKARTLLPHATYPGAAATASHNTGPEGSVCENIVGIGMVLPDGSDILLNKRNSDFATLKGAMLGLGGIIFATYVQCEVVDYKLQCTRKTMTLENFLEKHLDTFGKESADTLVLVPSEPIQVCLTSVKKVDIDTKPTPLDTLEKAFEEGAVICDDMFHINELLKAFPYLIPAFIKIIEGAVLKDDVLVGDPPFIYHPRKSFPRDIPHDRDFLFHLDPDNNQLRKVLELCAAAIRSNNDSFVYPLYFRTFQGTEGGMSTSANGPVCAMDIVGIDTPGFKKALEEITTFCIDKLGAKMHLGKELDIGDDRLEEMYGAQSKKFVQALQELYEKHELKFEESLFLTPYLRKFLNVGLELHYEPRKVNEAIVNPKPTHAEMASYVLNKLESTSHADPLRKYLKTIAQNQHLVSQSKHGLNSQGNAGQPPAESLSGPSAILGSCRLI